MTAIAYERFVGPTLDEGLPTKPAPSPSEPGDLLSEPGRLPSESGALATGFTAALLPARVETEDGRQHFALLGPGPRGSLRLVSTSILLGKKVRVAILRPGHREHLVDTARVLRTLRLSQRLYEHGAAILSL
jgi:hypothetical protein